MDVTPGITALNAALPELLLKFQESAATDESAALAAFQADITRILQAETAVVSQILAGAEAMLDRQRVALFAELDARLGPGIKLWSAPGA